MVKKEADFSEVSYVLGIISIILVVFQPLLGLVLGVVGFTHSRKQKTPLSKKAKKLNIVGMVLNGIFALAMIGLIVYSTKTGTSPFA
jgi:heme/copper-type cytochrome/quinol oxidase subunit 2